MSDPIADLLTRMRNASKAKLRYFDVGYSRIKENIVKLLKEEGFISQYLFKEENKKGTLRVFIKYTEEREPVIKELKRVSKPSRRCYVTCQEIPKVMGGMGIAVLSTSQGVLVGENARQRRVGGELLCLVW